MFSTRHHWKLRTKCIKSSGLAASHFLLCLSWTFLEDLELPGVLVLVVQAVHWGKAQLPGLLVFVVQAVNGGEAQGGGSAVTLGRQRGWGLAQGAPNGGHTDGAEGAHGAGQLWVHWRQVGTAVQASKVGGCAGIAMTVGGWLAIIHGVRWWVLHAGGRSQRVRQGWDSWTPDWHRSVSSAGVQGQTEAWLSRGGAVGTRWVRDKIRGAGFLHWWSLLFGWPGFRLATTLLLLLTALSTTVLEPNLAMKRSDALGDKLLWEMCCCCCHFFS